MRGMPPHLFCHDVYRVHAKRDGAPLCDWCDQREGEEIHVPVLEPCRACERHKPEQSMNRENA